MASNTVRIAKNTLALYFRQILIMLVSLYTVRVVLEILGAEDYGIYNVMAGVVTMFGFLSNSMATASQRYFSFELGRGDFEQLKKLFSLTILIYVLIGVLVLLLAETIGLWFISNKLIIPLERKEAALWVYQFSIFSFLFTILTSPYMAMIISHEEMNIYAYVSIIEVLLKLGIVFVLRFITWDKLILYSFLILIITVIIAGIYLIVCTRKYEECKFSFYWNNILFKEVSAYTGWYLFIGIATIGKNQGINVLLNNFFNPVVVAARSIAAQVNSAAATFSLNFSKAIQPQIIKSYASGQKETMLLFLFQGSKCTYLLMYLFVLPLLLEMPIILGLWLKNPPEYSILFAQLVLFDVLIDGINYPFITAVQATGNIRIYQPIVGFIILFNLPVSWIILRIGAPAYSVFLVAIVFSFILNIARLLIAKYLIKFSIRQFLKIVFSPVLIISILSAILPITLRYILVQSIFRLCLVFGISFFSICICGYYIGLSEIERMLIKRTISGFFNKNKI